MLRKPLDGRAVTIMLALCAIWGLQQVAVKVAAPALNPVLQIGSRSLVASCLLVALMLWRGERFWHKDGSWGAGLLAGSVFAAEFLFVAWGLMYTTASHMVVFLYTTPIFTALGLHWTVPGERLNRAQWSGILLAFAGIVIAFSTGFFRVGELGVARMLVGDAFGILAGLLWAATTVIIRATVLSEMPATRVLLYQLVMAGIVLTTLGAMVFQTEAIVMNSIAWTSMVFQSVIVAFVSLLSWFWLLRHYLASRLSVFSFMTPLFGVTFGVVLLNEPLDGGFVAGAVMVSLGITLVNAKRG